MSGNLTAVREVVGKNLLQKTVFMLLPPILLVVVAFFDFSVSLCVCICVCLWVHLGRGICSLLIVTFTHLHRHGSVHHRRLIDHEIPSSQQVKVTSISCCLLTSMTESCCRQSSMITVINYSSRVEARRYCRLSWPTMVQFITLWLSTFLELNC